MHNPITDLRTSDFLSAKRAFACRAALAATMPPARIRALAAIHQQVPRESRRWARNRAFSVLAREPTTVAIVVSFNVEPTGTLSAYRRLRTLLARRRLSTDEIESAFIVLGDAVVAADALPGLGLRERAILFDPVAALLPGLAERVAAAHAG